MNVFKWIVPLVIIAVMSGCSTTKKANNSSEYFNRQWMLKSLPGITGEKLLAAKANINLTDLSKTGGFAGCNKIFFTTTRQAGGRIRFTDIGSTRMYCEDFMDTERRFISALEAIRSYTIDGHFIRFKNDAGQVLIEAVAADWD